MESFLTLDDESNSTKKKAPASHETSCPLTIRYHGQNESDDVCYCVWGDSEKLCLKVLIPKASDNCRSKERERRDANTDAQIRYIVYV